MLSGSVKCSGTEEKDCRWASIWSVWLMLQSKGHLGESGEGSPRGTWESGHKPRVLRVTLSRPRFHTSTPPHSKWGLRHYGDLAYSCSVFQNRRITWVRYSERMGCLSAHRTRSCRMS